MTLTVNAILECGAPLGAKSSSANSYDASSMSSSQHHEQYHHSFDLPTEVTLLVLEYLDWGDYARLASVQSAWSSIMYTAAAEEQQEFDQTMMTTTTICMNDRIATTKTASSYRQQQQAIPNHKKKQWQLAQALLHGTNGLQVHTTKAMELLLELAGVEVDPITRAPTNVIVGDVEKASSFSPAVGFAPAMRLIADFYLNQNDANDEQQQQAVVVDNNLQHNQTPNDDADPSSNTTTTNTATTSNNNHNMTNAQLGVKWLESAFALGRDVEAAHALALLYEHGTHRGVELDVVAAAQWLERAARAGHTEAMAELGLCYELGCGVEQSDEQALDWYMRAADQGSLVAKYSVGEAFEEARGVPQSHEEACLWYYKAAMEGDEDAKTALRRLRDIARIVLPGVSALLDG